MRAWRSCHPGITLRSTFIVGFPGETDADFAATLKLAADAGITLLPSTLLAQNSAAATNVQRTSITLATCPHNAALKDVAPIIVIM